MGFAFGVIAALLCVLFAGLPLWAFWPFLRTVAYHVRFHFESVPVPSGPRIRRYLEYDIGLEVNDERGKFGPPREASNP